MLPPLHPIPGVHLNLRATTESTTSNSVLIVMLLPRVSLLLSYGMLMLWQMILVASASSKSLRLNWLYLFHHTPAVHLNLQATELTIPSKSILRVMPLRSLCFRVPLDYSMACYG
jgi:hypothetical protein